MTFLMIDLSAICAGLSHQKSNLVHLIRYCHSQKLKLIKPIFRLCGSHNKGKEIQSDLSKYYDLDKISVNASQFPLYDSIKFTYGHKIPKREYNRGLLKSDDLFNNFAQIDNSLKVTLPYQKQIIEKAKLIATKLNNNFMCIHVRRGDRVTSKQIDIDTQPDNILKCIRKQSHKSIYIMTNRVNEIAALKNNKDYNICFYTDFDTLRNIDDNYYLFCIENAIMELANIRCSTFKTTKTAYYHHYLTETPGMQ